MMHGTDANATLVSAVDAMEIGGETVESEEHSSSTLNREIDRTDDYERWLDVKKETDDDNPVIGHGGAMIQSIQDEGSTDDKRRYDDIDGMTPRAMVYSAIDGETQLHFHGGALQHMVYVPVPLTLDADVAAISSIQDESTLEPNIGNNDDVVIPITVPILRESAMHYSSEEGDADAIIKIDNGNKERKRVGMFVLSLFVLLMVVSASFWLFGEERVNGLDSNTFNVTTRSSDPTPSHNVSVVVTKSSLPSLYSTQKPTSPSLRPSGLPSASPTYSRFPTLRPSNPPSVSTQPTGELSDFIPNASTLRNRISPTYSRFPTQGPSNPPSGELSDFIPNVSTLQNQIICGYQGWFATPGDGASYERWRHWFSSSDDPSVEHVEVDMYPYTEEYDGEDLEESNIQLRDGSKAKFFSSTRPNVVKKHFEWMRDYGISGVFHMRFMEHIDIPANYEWKTSVLRNVMAAAQSTGRVFAVSYNIAGHTLDESVLDLVKEDWMNLVDNEKITSSGRYLHHNRLPVLRIYGIGFKEVNITDAIKVANLIDWFKTSAEKYRVFLVGGVPSGWRELIEDSREDEEWKGVYQSLDGIHPWHVGRWNSTTGFEVYNSNMISRDAALCAELGILYMPTMWPGFSWHNLNRKRRDENGLLKALPISPINSIPRLGGKLMWSQAYGFARNVNITSIWMAQFDEVDEGTAIFKVAMTEDELPIEGNWLTLDADGEHVPRDWYLRLCGQAQQMMLGNINLTQVIPIDST